MGILTKGEYTVTDLEDGKDAKLLYLTASSQVQAFDKDNKPKTTQAITISAKLQNASGTATFTAIPYIGNIAQTAITLGGTGNNRTLLPSQWTNTQWTTIAITATLGSLTDTISIIKVKDGITGPKGDPGNQGIPGTPGADGRTPYTHWAYAWSADGTDRFTTVYPQENLWNQTMGKVGYINEYGVGVASTPHQWYCDEYFQITGSKFIRQFWNPNKTTNTTSIARTAFYDSDKNFLSVWNHFLTQDVYHSASFNVPANAKYCRVNIINGSGGVVDPDIKWKFEFDYPTIYTPSPSEDYANAYPLYEGTYTDYSDTASQNPADYTWRRIIGESGQDGVAGKDGVGIKSTAIQYAQSTSGTTAPTTGWATNVPTLVKGQYLWTKTVWTYTDDSSETGYTVSYNAKDGNTGKDGIAGKDGVGISNTVIEYVGAVSGTSKPTSGWSTTIPTVPQGQYLWTRTTWQYTDGTSEQGFTNALMGRTGASGKDGVAGKDGVGIKSTQIMYAQSTSGTTAPTSGWTAQVPTLIKGQYLWTQTTWVYTDNTGESGYTVSYNAKDGNNGTDGVAGKDGVGIKSTKIEYVGSTSGTTKPTTGWATTIPTVAAGSFLWTRTTLTYTDNTTEQVFSVAKMGNTGAQGPQGATGPKGDKGDDGVAGADGKGIKSTAVTYQASTSGTTAPTGTWVVNPPTVTKGQYLWTRTIWTYTDDTTEPGYSVAYVAKDGNTGKDGIAGKDGVGIKSTDITYAVSSSGTTAPTSGWVASPPAATAGQFMWTKTVWTYTDNTTETGYSVGKIGEKGATGATGKDGVAGKDGVGIASTTINYAQSTSGTTAPTSGWSTSVPTLVKGQYLWTRTVWTYSDSTNETGYTVSYNAKDGNTGKDGIAGKDGVGIKSTKVEYVGSSSGTVKPTTGWSTTIPTVAEGSFLWTKTTWTYTDSTTEVGYSVSKMGAKGAKGDQGIQGPQGPNGQTYYTWLKYADSPTTGMSDSPTNKKYMGLAYNKTTATESSNYADYTWSLIQGPQGNQGIQGPTGANGQPTYTWIKYGTSASGAGMSDNPTGKTYIGIAYNKTTATESTNAADYTWSLIQGPKGDTGPQGPAGPKGDRGVMGVAYMQPTQPSDTTEGATWFKTESTDSDKIIGVYTYKSGWQEKKYASAALAVENLSALSANLGNVTAGNITGVTINGTTITGSEIVNEFDYQDPNVSAFWHKGTSLIKDAKIAINKTLYTKSTGEEHSKSRYELDDLIKGLLVETATADGVSYDRLLVTSTGIGLKSSRYTPTYGEVNLRYQDLMTLPTVGIPAASGWTQYATSGGSRPTATRNGRIVQLAGAFKNDNLITAEDANTRLVMGILPQGYRPANVVTSIAQGSGSYMYTLTVQPDGKLLLSRYRGWDGRIFGYKSAAAGSWLGIACVYAARDL